MGRALECVAWLYEAKIACKAEMLNVVQEVLGIDGIHGLNELVEQRRVILQSAQFSRLFSTADSRTLALAS